MWKKTKRCLFKTTEISLGVLIVAGTSLNAIADGELYGVQSRASTPAFQLFVNLNNDSSVLNPNAPLFQTQGGVYAAAFLNDSFYGVELENGTGSEFLNIIPHVGAALGVRVSPTTSVGFSNVEAMATVDGKLLATSLYFGGPNHDSTLIEINPATGVGTLIGTGSQDVMIVGLAYDPVGNILYGAGIPYSTVNGHNLFTINPQTGATTLVGPLGAAIQGLAWSPTLGLVGTFDHLYTIDTKTGAATQVGNTDFTDGRGLGASIFNGIYAVAAIQPELPDIFRILSVTRDELGEVEIVWESENGFNYQLEYNESVAAPSWSEAGNLLPGAANSMSTTHAPDGVLGTGLYRVVKTTN